MSNKRLYLFLVVNVPYPDNPVLAATDQVLSIGSETEGLIEVALDGSIVLLSLEQYFLVRLQVPLDQTTVLGGCEH